MANCFMQLENVGKLPRTKFELAKDGKLTILDRTKRVKEARDEAKKEIEAYRKSKDEEFKKFESEVCCPWHCPCRLGPKIQLAIRGYVVERNIDGVGL